MRTVPVKYSSGPLPDGCEPLRLISMPQNDNPSWRCESPFVRRALEAGELGRGLRGLTLQIPGVTEVGLHRPDVVRAAFRQPDVRAVRFDAKKLLADQLLENSAAGVAIDAAETMDLLSRQSQARHFEEFGAETFENRFHGDLSGGNGGFSHSKIASASRQD